MMEANGRNPPRAIPPLVNGDRLTVEEFERRYEAMPHLKKAELIQGVVYMPSPVSIEEHGEQQFDLIGWLWVYRANKPGVQGGDNSTLRLPAGMNQPQPDACLRVRPDYGGRSRTSTDAYVVGGCEFLGEIARSSASYDLHEKFDAYQVNGVLEYLVWRVEDRAIDWYALRGGVYRKTLPRAGVLKSKAFPGLWLDAPAMLNGDMPRVLKVLQKGLKSDEHRRFVARLARRKQAADHG
jgi:Uma2 family endonuclease